MYVPPDLDKLLRLATMADEWPDLLYPYQRDWIRRQADVAAGQWDARPRLEIVGELDVLWGEEVFECRC